MAGGPTRAAAAARRCRSGRRVDISAPLPAASGCRASRGRGGSGCVDRREDIFRPFFRLETSRNRETGGSGLGLAVARSIARRHGGDIVLEDSADGGLTVRLSLPHTRM